MGILPRNTLLLLIISLSLLHVGVCLVAFHFGHAVYQKKKKKSNRFCLFLTGELSTIFVPKFIHQNIFLFFFFSLFSIIIICNYFYAIRTFSGIVTITRELLEIKVSLICAGMFCSLYNRHTYTKKKKMEMQYCMLTLAYAFNTIDMQILLMLWCAVYGGGGKNVTMDDRVVSKLLLYSVLAKNWIQISVDKG